MEGCGLNCMKYLLFVFNFIIWLGGLGMLALGIILYFGIENWIPIEELAMLLDNDLLKSSSYILIAAGGLVFLLAFCGCCGAIMESKCLLVLYFLVLLIVFCGQLGAGILASIFSNDVDTALNDKLKMSFAESYGNDTDKLTEAWRSAESILDCCGYTNGADYKNDPMNSDGVDSLYKHNSDSAYMDFPDFPSSCCVGASEKKEFDGDDKVKCKAQWSLDAEGSQTEYHGKGCRKLVEELINDYILWIGAGAIGVACVELFCMLFAICLCRNVEDND